jgi:hypothetical protein
VDNATSHKKINNSYVKEGKDRFKRENGPFSFVRRRKKCGRKEKQEKEIGENLSLGKRKKEKRPARRRNSPDLKGNSPDRLR